MAESNGKIRCVYSGPPGCILHETGEALIPGVTIVEVGAFEAESEHWTPADPAAKKAYAKHESAVKAEEPAEPESTDSNEGDS